jgi:hypothetical protein
MECRGQSSGPGVRQVRQLPSAVDTSTPIMLAGWWGSASGVTQAITSAMASSMLL